MCKTVKSMIYYTYSFSIELGKIVICVYNWNGGIFNAPIQLEWGILNALQFTKMGDIQCPPWGTKARLHSYKKRGTSGSNPGRSKISDAKHMQT